MYKVRDLNGKNSVGIMKVDFLASKYSEPHLSKQYNFAKFTTGFSTENEKPEKDKFDLKHLQFDKAPNGDVDPIKTNTTDSKFLIDNEDAIIFDINRKNNKN